MGFLSLVESRFVLDTDAARKSLKVPNWAAFSQAGGLVSADDVRALRMVEGQSPEAINEILAQGSNAQDFGRAACRVLSSVADADAVRYTLHMVEDALLPDTAGNASRMFGDAGETDLLSGEARPQEAPKLRIAEMSGLVAHPDVQVRAKGIYVLSLLLSVAATVPEQADLRKAVLNAVVSEIDGSTARGQSISAAIQSLSVLLRTSQMRADFDARNGILALLGLLDRSFGSMGGDTQYNAVLCTWLACFHEQAAAKVDQASLGTLVMILRSEPRVRVVRTCLATIHIALASEARQHVLCEALIELKLPKLLAQIKNRQNVTDQELLDDLEWIEDTLSRNFKVLTTFERHEQELLSKKLAWSMVHEEIFWRENALKFQHNNFSSVERLIELLRSEDDLTVAVAASDIGYFVQYFPNGKLIVEKYGGKQAIMTLLSHRSQEVQKQALSACSKIMVTNWEAFKART